MPDVNGNRFNQLAAVLNSIHEQATGTSAAVATDSYGFVSQAQATLRTGYDAAANAVSFVLSRTIFGIRPYSARFRGLQASAERYGNHVRKINYGDTAWRDDDRFLLPDDGTSVDQQLVLKPDVLQTNFYGTDVFSKGYTLYKDQLDAAFRGPDEFDMFVTGVVQNASDMLEQSREELCRMMLANYIGGKIYSVSQGIQRAENVVHLLTEYNTQTGLSLTVADIYKPANFKAFMAWVYSRIAELCALMTERSNLFHTCPTVSGKTYNIMRHTPYARQKVYLYAPMQYATEARALADTYHDNYLRLADHETVNFWQSIISRDSINVKANYMKADGTYPPPADLAVVDQSGIFGVIFDEETLGWTQVNAWQAPAPFNARGGYTTVWMHESRRYWTDMTENGMVLLLD